VDWLLLAAFGMMWAALLLPGPRRRARTTSVEEFERDMDLLAHAEAFERGRWIVTPRKGVPFLGSRDRARARARERRRRVFVFLLEIIALTFLIGVVPPLRAMWFASAAAGGVLLLYVWLLLSIKARSRSRSAAPAAHSRPAAPARGAAPAARSALAPIPEPGVRYVAEGNARTPRPTFNGLGSAEDEDSVHVVVLPASEVLSAARA
jgi:hypothetical protein